jgi:hypothetical protein
MIYFSDDFKPLFKTAASEFSHHEIVRPVIYKGDQQLPSTKDKVFMKVFLFIKCPHIFIYKKVYIYI